MRILTVTMLLMSLAVASLAQEAQTDTTASGPQRLLIVPFEDRMFFSDVMQEMVQGSGLGPEEVVNALRNGIQLRMQMVLKDSAQVGTFLSADSIPPDGLTRIYEKLSYRYLPVRPNPKAPEQQRGGIERGQIKSVRDTTTRYMAAEMKDSEPLNTLHGSHGFDRFLFITQLEVRMDLSDPEQSVLLGKRTVAVHYTLTDLQGQPLAGGLIDHHLSGGSDNVNKVMAEAFPPIARQLCEAMFPKKTEEKKKQKR